MAINNFTKSDLSRIHSIVQNAMIMHPKEMIIAILKKYFSEDSYYRYLHDEWGYNKIVDHTDLALDAGISNNETTRISIIESFQFGIIHYPALVIRHNGSSSFPLSINNEYTSIKYEDIVYQDGYGNSLKFKTPTNFIFGGAWEGSINIDVMARDIKSRDDIAEYVGLILSPGNNLAYNELRKAGIVIKKLSVSSPSEQDDRNDKVFVVSITLDIFSEWRREPPVGNIIEVIDFAVEFGRVDVPDYPIPPNLTIHNILGYIDSVKLATDDTFNDSVNTVDFNNLRIRVINIETELGTDPSGFYGTIRDRLDFIDDEIANIQTLYNYAITHLPYYINFTNDLFGSHTTQTVVGLQNRSLLNTSPNINDVIGWTGSAWAPVAFTNVYPIGPAGGDLISDYPTPTTNAINGFLLPSNPLQYQVFLVDNSNNLSYDFLVNTNFSNSANISGLKVFPDFGSQNIVNLTQTSSNSLLTDVIDTNALLTLGASSSATNFKINNITKLSIGNSKINSVNSGFRVSTKLINTSEYTALQTDYILFVDTSTSLTTIKLYASPTVGDILIVKDISDNAAINAIVLDGNGHSIEGNSSYTISVNHASATVYYSTLGWQVI